MTETGRVLSCECGLHDADKPCPLLLDAEGNPKVRRQSGRTPSPIERLAKEQGVEPFDPDTFQPLDLTDEEREGLDAALASGRCSLCGRQIVGHNGLDAHVVPCLECGSRSHAYCQHGRTAPARTPPPTT